MTKYHWRRRLIRVLRWLDPSYEQEWTLRWARRRRWVGSTDGARWYMRDDHGREAT